MIGRSAARPEDARLLRGEGRYSADRLPAGTLHAAFVRSPHAHAAIGRIDTAAARALPGVVAVLDGRELAAAGVEAPPQDATDLRELTLS